MLIITTSITRHDYSQIHINHRIKGTVFNLATRAPVSFHL